MLLKLQSSEKTMRPTTKNENWKEKVKSKGKCRIAIKGN